MKKTAKIIIALLSLVIMTLLGGCTSTGTTSATPSPSPKPTTAPTATSKASVDLSDKTKNAVKISIEMQDGGVIKADLYPDIAPVTVANFTKLINEHFFDGLIFHRVMPGFMIQGGGYDTKNEEKKTSSIKGEFTQNGFQNDLKHTRGVLSMARTLVPDSASSQFFIMHADYPSLDGQYAGFGMVTSGMDVVDKIAKTPTTTLNNMFENYPSTPQVIKTITIDK